MPGKTKIFSIVNQKGGVGKTTTVTNLATALAAVRKKILLIDCDSQGNSSTGLGIPQGKRSETVYDLMIRGADLTDVIYETDVPELDIIPADPDLAAAEVELIRFQHREFKLKSILTELVNSEHYDYIFIDCPPSLSLLTINALVSSDFVIVPLQCEFFALEGLSNLLRTIDMIRRNLNSMLQIHGVLLTMYDQRIPLNSQIEQEVRGFLAQPEYNIRVYNTIIPRNIRMSEAQSYGKAGLLYDYRCSASKGYIKFASEFLKIEKSIQVVEQGVV